MIRLSPGANVIKLFNAATYRHSMVILSFCVIKLNYLVNYHGMAVKNNGKKLSMAHGGELEYRCNLP